MTSTREERMREIVKGLYGDCRHHWKPEKICEICNEDIDQALSQILSLIRSCKPKKKDEIETCTRCGGIGRIPNNPHILAYNCERCNGSGKIERKDYKMFNSACDEMEKNIDDCMKGIG